MFRSWILFATTSILFSTAILNTSSQYMTHYDLTKDGKVDKRELRTVAYMDHKLPPTISDEIFWKADHNGDKFIDRTEIIAAVRSIQRHVARATSHWLEDHDMDGDGRMNEMELFESIYMEHGLAMEDVNGCFRESDINKDKYLTSDELVEMLQCSRLLALKEAKELMKIYDTDGDRRLNIQEAQMLASLRYDIEPDYATIVLEDVNHRTDHTINELELIDFLTKLREEAAIAALNKLSSLDMNGDEAVSFSELLQGYEKQLKKSVLKKIFSKVDVNKNAHIDPIEYVSLQNLIADKIHLQTIQNDFEQRHSTIIDTTTSLPTLIIFRTPKKPPKQPSRRRIRRSDSETDKKLTVSDDSQPGIKELTATNANNVYFTTAATAVPRIMELNNNYQRFISNGAKLFDMLTDSKHKEEIKRDDIRKTWEKLIAGIGGSTPLLIQKDRKLTSNINKGQMGTSSTTDKSGYAQEQNGALGNSPSIAYMKKFGKFFDFLEKAFKKVTEAVKENDEKQNNEKQSEFLESPLKGINIFKHLSPIDNISNTRTNEIEKIANVTEIPISVPTTTTKRTKTRGDRKDAIYRKSRNEENLIVHTPVDTSEYKTITSERFSGSFDAPFLQLDNEIVQEKKEAKMTDYEANSREAQERSSEESDLLDEEEKDEKEKIADEDCTLENRTDSFDSENSSEHQIKSIKENKCNMQAQRSNETTGIELLQKASEEVKKEKSNIKSINQKKRRQKLQSKFSSKADSLEHETTPAFLDNVENESNLFKMENKSSSISHKIYFENDNDEFNEMFPEAEGEEESGELFDKRASTKHIYFNESSEQESADRYAKSTMQSSDSGKLLNEKLSNLTDKFDKQIHSSRDSTNLKKNFAKTKEYKLSLHKIVQLKKESELPDRESKDNKFLEPNLMFSKKENIIKKHDQEMHLRSKTADSQILKLQNSSSEQMESQTVSTKYQEILNNSKEDEVSDETVSYILNATLPKIYQTSVAPKIAKSGNQKKTMNSKKKKSPCKHKKNNIISQFPKTSTISSSPQTMSAIFVASLSSPESSTTIDPCSTAINPYLKTIDPCSITIDLSSTMTDSKLPTTMGHSTKDSKLLTTMDHSTTKPSSTTTDSKLSTTMDHSTTDSELLTTMDHSTTDPCSTTTDSKLSTTIDHSTTEPPLTTKDSELSTTMDHSTTEPSSTTTDSKLSTTIDRSTTEPSLTTTDSKLSTTMDHSTIDPSLTTKDSKLSTTMDQSTTDPCSTTTDSKLSTTMNHSTTEPSLTTKDSELSTTMDHSTTEPSSTTTDSKLSTTIDRSTTEPSLTMTDSKLSTTMDHSTTDPCSTSTDSELSTTMDHSTTEPSSTSTDSKLSTTMDHSTTEPSSTTTDSKLSTAIDHSTTEPYSTAKDSKLSTAMDHSTTEPSSTSTDSKFSTTMDHSTTEPFSTSTDSKFSTTMDHSTTEPSSTSTDSKLSTTMDRSTIDPSPTTKDSKLSTMIQNDTIMDEQNSTEVDLIQKEREECPCQRRYPTEDDISTEITIPTTKTADVICNEKDLSYKCQLKKQYRSKNCSNNQKNTDFLDWLIEISKNIDSPEQHSSQKNGTESLHQTLKTNQSQVGEWRTEKHEDLLLRAVQEYHKYIKSQKSEKRMKD